MDGVAGEEDRPFLERSAQSADAFQRWTFSISTGRSGAPSASRTYSMHSSSPDVGQMSRLRAPSASTVALTTRNPASPASEKRKKPC